MEQQLKVGIIGVGVVGSALARLLKRNEEIITARSGKKIIATKGVSRDLEKSKKLLEGVELPMESDINFVLDDPSIDIVVELMGGVDSAFEVAKKALEKGKHFVTANKAMLAYHRYDIAALCAKSGTGVGFEASVCGGIPIIKVLKDGLVANNITALRGIMNGTSNYILTQMAAHGVSFEAALKDAQRLGYAEADPSLDINGADAAHKLLIIASIAFGIRADLSEILVEGIERINALDMDFAREFGYTIKLLAIAKKCGQKVELRVHPTMLPTRELLSKVDGVMNAVSVVGDSVGETLYYGAGAGGDATASSVASDLVEIARDASGAMFGFSEVGKSAALLKPIDEVESRFFVRLFTDDRPGVLAQISQVLGAHNISIKALLQKPGGEKSVANLLFSTHKCLEADLNRALGELEKLDAVKEKPYRIHIEEA